MKKEFGDGERLFWDLTGREIPAFYDAPSTRYYLECEKSLFENYFPDLRGKKILKTDLWDEAKNSRILLWAAEQGADAYGIDISVEILKEALNAFAPGQKHFHPRFIVSDVHSIGFPSNTFDYLYSMGTVEHSPDYLTALEEYFRVLKKGGRAIIGVPNKLDPFLRPAFVCLLDWLGLYAYGYELSFTAREFKGLLERIGFRVIDTSGILFMPGLLRIADLYLYCHIRWATALTAPLVAPFAYLYRRFPWLRRHGYLIACAVEKP